MSFARSLARPTTAVAWWHWLPLVLAPAAAWWLTLAGPGWAAMFAIAFGVVAGLKWLVWAQFVAAGGRMSTPRAIIFLFVWPGMNAEEFAGDEAPPRPEWWEWPASVAIMLGGFGVMFLYAPRLLPGEPLLAGAAGMFGFLFGLLFGAFWLLALVWRSLGIPATPIMNTPIAADSLADYWGRRWNLAFRDVANATLFRPLAPLVGTSGAMVAVFLFSGLLHELAMSLSARAGYGLPTLYFLTQAGGLALERSAAGRAVGLGRGLPGRMFAAAVILGPVLLLFHPSFLTSVIAPMLAAWASR